jgi:hypothetical protein
LGLLFWSVLFLLKKGKKIVALQVGVTVGVTFFGSFRHPKSTEKPAISCIGLPFLERFVLA